jgi:hypothetical protein
VKSAVGNKFKVLTRFASQDAVFDSTANLIYALQDTLLQKITDKQWETIAVFRRKRRLQTAATELGFGCLDRVTESEARLFLAARAGDGTDADLDCGSLAVGCTETYKFGKLYRDTQAVT